MQALLSIPKVCQTIGGIQAMVIFETSNLTEIPPPSIAAALSYADPSKVYTIVFERNSARYTEQSRDTTGGDVYDFNLNAFIPKRRAEMETLISALRNRRINAVYVGKDGYQGLVWNARFRYKYDSGDKPGARNGYSISFTGTHLRQLPVIEGSATLPDPCAGSGGGGGGGGCCVVINPVPLDYIPSPTGNAANRNEVVVALDGNIYLIDDNGNSIVLGGLPPRYYRIQHPGTTPYIVVPLSRPLPDPADYPFPGYQVNNEISKRLWVKRNTLWQVYNVDYSIAFVSGEQRLYFTPWINSDMVEVYVFSYPKTTPLVLTIDPGGG